MNKEIFVFEGVNEIEDFIIAKWREISQEALVQKDNFTIALSGGKTPVSLYQKLARLPEMFAWDKTHIFLVDERFVPFSNVESNYRMIKESFLDQIKIPEGNIHPIHIEQGALQSAQRYEKELQQFFDVREIGIPKFDVVMLGVGQDGHVASLFVQDKVIEEKYRLVVVVKRQELKNERITLTLPVINNAKNIIFYVTGENKAAIMKEIINRQNGSLPVSLVRPLHGCRFFVLDHLAASLL